MRRSIFATSLLAAAFVAAAPLGQAASQVDLQDADLQNLDGEPLSRIPVGTTVSLVAELVNKGTDSFSGTVNVVFHVTNAGTGYNFEKTVTKDITLAPNNRTNVTYEWAAETAGNHTLDVTLQGMAATPFKVFFVASKTEVVRGSLVERVLDSAWFYAAFLVVLVLYVAVVRVRKPGP